MCYTFFSTMANRSAGERADGPAAERWLLLQFQLPPGKSSARVAIWRRLRALAATGLGGGAYALPDDAENRESCEWLRRDIAALGGEALLFAAQPIDEAARAALARRRRGAPAESAGDGEVALARLDPERFRKRVWVTRPRPGVDRMASAWLIRRFVDPQAVFAFSPADGAGPGSRSRQAIPFDTFGAELGHQQGLCTFEVLARRFGIEDPGVAELARTVHAIDLHEATSGPADAVTAALAATVARLVEGLRATHADDDALLAAGIALFAALHAAPDTLRPVAPRARNRAPAPRARRRQGPADRRRKEGRR